MASIHDTLFYPSRRYNTANMKNVKPIIPKQIECPICLEVNNSCFFESSCGHHVCQNCCDELYNNMCDTNKKINCPLCRNINYYEFLVLCIGNDENSSFKIYANGKIEELLGIREYNHSTFIKLYNRYIENQKIFDTIFEHIGSEVDYITFSLINNIIINKKEVGILAYINPDNLYFQIVYNGNPTEYGTNTYQEALDRIHSEEFLQDMITNDREEEELELRIRVKLDAILSAC